MVSVASLSSLEHSLQAKFKINHPAFQWTCLGSLLSIERWLVVLIVEIFVKYSNLLQFFNNPVEYNNYINQE